MAAVKELLIELQETYSTLDINEMMYPTPVEEEPINVTIVGVLEEDIHIQVYQYQLDDMENEPSISEIITKKYLKDRGFFIPEHNQHFPKLTTKTKYLQQYIIDNNHYFDVPENQLSYYYVAQVKYDIGNYYNETWYCGAYFDEEV